MAFMALFKRFIYFLTIIHIHLSCGLSFKIPSKLYTSIHSNKFRHIHTNDSPCFRSYHVGYPKTIRNSSDSEKKIFCTYQPHEQITGVWHFYLPHTLYHSPLITANTTSLFERIWAYDDGTALSPSTGCKGNWTCSSTADNDSQYRFELTLGKKTLPNIHIVLNGYLNLSDKPIFTQWDGHIQFHAAQIIGMSYQVVNESSNTTEEKISTQTNILRLPDGFELIDNKGNKHQHLENVVTHTENSANSKKNDRSCSFGTFLAYRILGEDPSESLPRTHFFSDKGPKRVYNIPENVIHSKMEEQYFNSPTMNFSTHLDISRLRKKVQDMNPNFSSFEKP